MRKKTNRISLAAALCAATLLASCSAKKPISSTHASFRLQSLNNDSLLLTPAIPENHSSTAAIKIILPAVTSSPSTQTNCSAERDPFKVTQENADHAPVEITLPAPEQWLGDLQGGPQQDGADEVEALYAILADVDRLQRQGCFSNTGVSVRDFLLQSIPMRPNESLFNAYGYRMERSSLDLKPGMRLKIERAYFRPADTPEEEHAPKNFLGISTLYFDVAQTTDAKIQFQQDGNILYSPVSLASQVQEASRDLSLARLPQQSHYRLLFYTYLVPKQHQRSAAILGASDASQLDELDRQLRAQPDADGCKSDDASHGVTCLDFDGFVTLSTQINVELNGKTQFIDWGSRVRDVLSKTSIASVPKSLKIQRQFMNSYYDVRFDPADPNILSLALIGGDRLAWSKHAHAQQ